MIAQPIKRRVPTSLEVLESRIAPATFNWVGGNSGGWSSPGNWFNNDQGQAGFGVPDDSGDIARFDGTSPTVTLDGDYTIQQLQFANGANAILNNGNQLSSLSLVNPSGQGVLSAADTSSPQINVGVIDGSAAGLSISEPGTGTVTISGSLFSAATHGVIVKTGPGKLVLNGSGNNFVSDAIGFNVQGGTVQLNGSAATMTANVFVGNGANLQELSANQISDTVSVTLGSGSTLSLQGNDTIGQLFGSGLLILNDNQLTLATTSTFNGTFLSNGKLKLTGTTLTLGGTQNSTGATIDALGGTLNVTGDYSGLTFRSGISGEFNVVAGTGTVGSVTSNGGQGNVSPGLGTTPGILTVKGTFSPNAALLLAFTLNGTTAGTGHDQFILTGSGKINSGVTASFSGLATLPLHNGQSITIIDVQNGNAVPAFSNFAEGAVIGTTNGGASNLKISYAGGTGDDVTITAVANGSNANPDAMDDAVTLLEDTPTQFTVLGNDTDTNFNDTLSVQSITQPSHGSAVLQGNAISYFPASNFFGTDSLTYTISDGEGGFDTATVNITVNDVLDIVALAPTSIAANGKSATFLQVDGDTLIVKTNKGKFTAANFLYTSFAGNSGGTLETLDLSAATAVVTGFSFKGATITTSVTKGANGDGFADIGYVKATGTDLKAVAVKGDLGRIDAGDTNFKSAGLGTLSTLTMGVQGAATQPSTVGGDNVLLSSTVVGKLGALKVSQGSLAVGPTNVGFLFHTFIHVVGDGTPANFRYGSIGSIKFDLANGFGGAASIVDPNTGVGYASGTILAEGKIGKVSSASGIFGGAGDYSGSIFSRTSIGSVTVGKPGAPGSLAGDDGFDSGSIFAGNPDLPGGILAGKLGPVKIIGNLVGEDGANSSTLYADGGLSTVQITGTVTGGAGSNSGSIISGKGIGSVSVSGNYSGNLIAQNGNVGSVKIGGALQVGTVSGTKGLFINGTLGSLTVGALETNPGAGGFISVFGKKNADGTAKAGVAIGQITVKGNATGWNISTGGDSGAGPNPYASIGPVLVTGAADTLTVLASTAVGANGGPGGGDDAHYANFTLPNTFAAIASITIKGTSVNSIFEAQQIKAVKLNNAPIVLNRGPLNDVDVAIDTNFLSEI